MNTMTHIRGMIKWGGRRVIRTVARTVKRDLKVAPPKGHAVAQRSTAIRGLVARYTRASHNLCRTRIPSTCRFTRTSTSNGSTHNEVVTGFGVTWDEVTRSGRENPNSKVGVYVGDLESYLLFWDKLAPIIAKYHKIDVSGVKLRGLQPGDSSSTEGNAREEVGDVLQPGHDLTSPSFDQLVHAVDSESNVPWHVNDCRIRVARNLATHPFPSHMTDSQRSEVLRMLLGALQASPIFSSGAHIIHLADPRPLEEQVNDKQLLRSIREGNTPLFAATDACLRSAGTYDSWPANRAVIISEDLSTTAWVGEEDHLRVMSRWDGAQLPRAMACVEQVLGSLEEQGLELAHTPALGYITSCPSNLGTGMRASVQVRCEVDKLPMDTTASRDPKAMQDLVDLVERYDMQIRSSRGETVKDYSDAVYNISFTKRLGVTERDILVQLRRALGRLLKTDMGGAKG